MSNEPGLKMQVTAEFERLGPAMVARGLARAIQITDGERAHNCDCFLAGGPPGYTDDDLQANRAIAMGRLRSFTLDYQMYVAGDEAEFPACEAMFEGWVDGLDLPTSRVLLMEWAEAWLEVGAVVRPLACLRR